LSKIIKPHEIILQEPVFLEVRCNDIPVEESPIEIVTDTEGGMRDETERILKETEEMVIEILEKARLEAQNIIAEAEEEAQEIRLKTEKEAEKLKEQALDNGYLKGWEKAREEAEQQIEQARQQSEDLLQQAQRERLSIIGSCENIMVKMSMEIAKKIVEKELTTNPDIIIKLVKNIIDFMNTAEAYKILVNAEDFVTLAAEFGQQTIYSNMNDKNQIMADPNISRGGCIVETDLGSVDATLETRINSLEDALMDVVRYE